MVVKKDISGVDTIPRIVNALYIYSILYKSQKDHLSNKALRLYAELVYFKIKGDLVRGGIAKLPSKDSQSYVYVKRIKDSSWLEKKGEEFTFPEDVMSLATLIVEEQEVEFLIKV